MADIRDIRRLTISIVVLTTVEALLLFFLWLDDKNHFDWFLPTKMLGGLSFDTWALIFGGLFLAFVGLVALFVFSLPVAAGGGFKGHLRQVQCQECKAVFHMADTGRRPLMHECPNCQNLGIYDGRAPPVGKAPEPTRAKKVIQVGLTCQACHHDFHYTDAGVRPLKVQCPACSAEGTIQ